MSNELLEKYSIGEIQFPTKSGLASMLVNKDKILDVIQKIKEDEKLLYEQLIDITVIDNISSKSNYSNQRFTVIYSFLSLRFNKRLLILSNISEEDLSIDSITQIFESANWFEREVFDMYGVKFKNHPDLRRILTDYGFKGHPLRKDFPLTGFNEVRYSGSRLSRRREKISIGVFIFVS